jgi:hypothetical protein
MGPLHPKRFDERIFGKAHIPSWGCPTAYLLPPSLEVLKIGPDAETNPEIFEALARKPDLFPTLRKLVMTLHYRDQVTVNRIHQFRLHHGVVDGKDTSEFGYFNLELSEELLVLIDLKRACDRVGVELMLIYDDTELWKYKGQPHPVWEIPEQMRPWSFDHDPLDASDQYDYCVFPDGYSQTIGDAEESDLEFEDT